MDKLIKNASFSLIVKRSRFLAELLPCGTQDKARQMIRAQKAKYLDATHVVHAFIVGAKGEVRGMSDDGEPGGTAASPMMAVLMGRQCTNVMLTVTRWFGGTLLGTGGLVKAYGDAARGVIAAADSNGAFTELVEMLPFSFSCDYSTYDKVRRALSPFCLSGKCSIKEQYDQDVSVTGEVRADEWESFAAALSDGTNGAIRLTASAKY